MGLQTQTLLKQEPPLKQGVGLEHKLSSLSHLKFVQSKYSSSWMRSIKEANYRIFLRILPGSGVIIKASTCHALEKKALLIHHWTNQNKVTNWDYSSRSFAHIRHGCCSSRSSRGWLCRCDNWRRWCRTDTRIATRCCTGSRCRRSSTDSTGMSDRPIAFVYRSSGPSRPLRVMKNVFTFK